MTIMVGIVSVVLAVAVVVQTLRLKNAKEELVAQQWAMGSVVATVESVTGIDCSRELAETAYLGQVKLDLLRGRLPRSDARFHIPSDRNDVNDRTEMIRERLSLDLRHVFRKRAEAKREQVKEPRVVA